VTEQLVLLVVGFLLTSVVGGVLGWYFQERVWRQRHATDTADERHRQAIRTFEELSTLLDRRLYRMRRLWWAMQRASDGRGDHAAVAAARDDYREVLFDWNDNLNRLLALVRTYFGADTRQRLEDELFEDFAAIGRALDHGLFVLAGDHEEPIPRVGRRLNRLSKRVYGFNVRMLEQLDTDQLGSDATPSTVERPPADDRLEFGTRGRDVRELQLALSRAGHAVDPDGDFGAATYRAVLSVQRERGLEPTGVADARVATLLRGHGEDRSVGEGERVPQPARPATS
jgi:hypothetical protein